MAARRKTAAPPARETAHEPLRPGLPVRLLPHDWPFLYSVLANGDLVVKRRLPAARPVRRRPPRDEDDALM